MSTNGTGNAANGGDGDRTASLLNLLKFSGGGGGSIAGNQRQVSHESVPSATVEQPQHQQLSPPQSQSYHQQQPSQSFGHQQQSFQHQPSGLSQTQFPPNVHQIHQPAPTAADPSGLLAALMRGASQEPDEPKPLPVTVPNAPAAPQPPSTFGQGSPPADTTSYLLGLLNRTKPAQNEAPQAPMLTETSRSNDHTPRSPDRLAEAERYIAQQQKKQHQSRSSSYGVPQHQHQQESYSSRPAQEAEPEVALYQQLVSNLSHGSPHSQGSHPASSQGHLQILSRDHASPAGSGHREHPPVGPETSPFASPRFRHQAERTSSLHSHPSVKQTPTSSEHDRYSASGKSKDPGNDSFTNSAPQSDQAVQDAINRAEQDRARAEIADDINGMLQAKTEIDLQQNAQAAAQALKQELAREENEGVLEQSMPAEDAQVVHEIVENAAQGVVDSWESADQDEIIVIEDKEVAAVKVFNFPMKPWISISLQEGSTEPRPEFRPESIMDIARLRKDFDQIDRNLYTASQNYMTYGMSKQGGLRVIRQDDGKDAKIFTDTKDRIFNVAMSVTPSEYDGPQMEAIIGTGISGTVYWVKIKDGLKDHIEDAHLEQYGFALPPINASEGDAPGGALKTRARASTIHPEYFAVGRGKSINFIWPSYIMQNSIFKPGHDRVVDTDKLFSQCSLKINTGKAGKDFTFSQDDSVVVSLDKSGRVKFWDVRDLTATKEGSDPRAPLPAQSSLEVKEPLMTLASTPEGEKAWPTSVLLLDKQRPYQKRCALRYMIVGMKQNHTLQLWDLALGKPVQEFNLPHSKESDAVCSVMYHAATGMIIIGHPTRNSVYFAHLSAPRYNLKSVSQADYIQRLMAQDASIPQPESTAVISGVREYSFENRGILRSLDMLSNPAMVQDADEPTLFELYAMHSKGVACLLIKQPELGWSKDNKVLEAVDAVTEGVVTVSKLRSPQAPEAPSVSADAPQSRSLNRGPTKEVGQQAVQVPAESSQKVPDTAAPAKVKVDAKDTESSQPTKEAQPEKAERKSRKKKAAAQNSDPATNGTSSSTTTLNKSDAPRATGFSGDNLDSTISQLESRLNASLSESVKGSLKSLQGKLDEGSRVRDESFNQHQLKLLDMVSEVLNENTQKVLEALIHHQFTELLQPHVASTVQREIQNALPNALNRSLRSNEFVNSLADRVGGTVASSVQQELVNSIVQRLTPSINNVAKQSAQGVASEIHQQYREQFDHFKSQHAADTQKIDQLLSYVSRLTDMVSTMAQSQSSLQAEFLKFRQQPVHELPGVSGGPGSHPSDTPRHLAQQVLPHGTMSTHGPPSHQGSFGPGHAPSHTQSFVGSPQYMRGQQHMGSPQAPAPTSEQTVSSSNVHGRVGPYANQAGDADIDQDLIHQIRVIEQLIQEGRLQDAVIRWIQSGRETEIFRRCLSRYPPSKFEGIPHLLLLVVIATISKDLRPNPRLKEEVEWIEMAVQAFRESLPSYDWDQSGVREVMKSTSQTMQMLISRVKPLMASIADGYPKDPFLMGVDHGKLDWIVRSAENVLEGIGGAGPY
ncbi:WD40 repeat-like-containing domain [Sarocladium implicatum]|nr:WD40 repeat-like-containing domain [Sarocladium implicatum]